MYIVLVHTALMRIFNLSAARSTGSTQPLSEQYDGCYWAHSHYVACVSLSLARVPVKHNRARTVVDLPPFLPRYSTRTHTDFLSSSSRS